jgi:chitin synthase
MSSSYNRYPQRPLQQANTTTRRGAQPLHRGATLKRNITPDSDTAILPTSKSPHGPPSRKLSRGKTLTRPDRFVAPAPLINPHQAIAVAAAIPDASSKTSWFQPWSFYVTFITCWIPNFMLRACGLRQAIVQRAWREKVALCSICLILGGFVGFATIGLNKTLCPSNGQPTETIRLGEQAGAFWMSGFCQRRFN